MDNYEVKKKLCCGNYVHVCIVQNMETQMPLEKVCIVCTAHMCLMTIIFTIEIKWLVNLIKHSILYVKYDIFFTIVSEIEK